MNSEYVPFDMNAMGIPRSEEEFPLFFKLAKDSSSSSAAVSLQAVGSPPAVSLKTSYDLHSWTDYTVGDELTIHQGEKLFFAGDNAKMATNASNYNHFVISGGTTEAHGNVMSLLSTDFKDYTNLTTSYAFNSLFIDCILLSRAPALPATYVASYSYMSMFRNCQSLAEAPELPATTLRASCYYHMFQDCHSMVKGPDVLPAPKAYATCYREMFRNCYSLKKAPVIMARAIEGNAYRMMFARCESLVEAPELPIMNLNEYCYYGMFNGCYSLTDAPELPATSLVANCYDYMFANCTSLSAISVAFTDWNTTNASTTDWVLNVPSGGTFTCPSDLPVNWGSAFIPSGWTVSNF